MQTMKRRIYRRAMIRIEACLCVGRKVEGEHFTPLEKTLYAMRLKQRQNYDPLEARLSRLTPDARTRLRLYPLIPKA